MYPAVYSYKRANTRELELSIKSLKNIKGWNGEIIIVGDDPKLPLRYTHYRTKYDWGWRSRHLDEICAYLTAGEIVGDFIMMSDDIYCLKRWNIRRHHRGTLQEHIDSRLRNDSYSRHLKTTEQFLLENGKPTLSYEIHIPFLVNFQLMKVIVEEINPSQVLLLRSLLGNWMSEPSSYLEDTKNKPLTKDSVLYSSSNETFKYDEVSKYLC